MREPGVWFYRAGPTPPIIGTGPGSEAGMRRGENNPSRWGWILVGAGLLAFGAAAQSDDGALRATEHLKIENPKQLDAEKAEKIYQSIAGELTTFYAMSREPAAGTYRNWQRYNSAPYLSATHGKVMSRPMLKSAR